MRVRVSVVVWWLGVADRLVVGGGCLRPFLSMEERGECYTSAKSSNEIWAKLGNPIFHFFLLLGIHNQTHITNTNSSFKLGAFHVFQFEDVMHQENLEIEIGK